MTNHTIVRAARAGITLTIGLGLLAGCSGHAPGELGRLQQVYDACPTDQSVISYVTTDGSGSSQNEQITAERLDAIETVVERTAVCGGHMTVNAFSSGSGATVPIYDAEIQIPGATPNSRLRQVEEVVEEAMSEITAAYAPAIASVPGGGTDVTGLYRLLGEAQALRADARLEATILTDGLTNQGVVIDRVLTQEEATALADTVAVPQLPGAAVSVIGVGRVAGNPLPSEFIGRLVAFYDRLCQNTGAAQCLTVTDGR